jgi:hypothetical protein
MTKLMTMSTLAAVLSVATVTNASAFPHRGLAFAHGGAAAFHSGAAWQGAAWGRGGGFGWNGAGCCGGAVAAGAAAGFAAGVTAGWPYQWPYDAPAFAYVSPPGVYAGGAVIGRAYGYGGRAFVGGADRFVGADAGHFAGARAGSLRR